MKTMKIAINLSEIKDYVVPNGWPFKAKGLKSPLKFCRNQCFGGSNLLQIVIEIRDYNGLCIYIYIYPLVYTLESIFLEITMVWGFYHWDLRLHSSDLRSRCGSVLPAWPSAAALVSRALGAQFAQGQRKDRAVISHSVQGLNLFWTRNYAHSMCNVVSKKGIVFQKMIMIMLSNIYILSCFMGCIIIYYNHP